MRCREGRGGWMGLFGKTTAATPKAPPAGRVHVVAKGDTLGSIAVRYYGGLSGIKKIQEANQEALQGGDKLKLGMKLKIP